VSIDRNLSVASNGSRPCLSSATLVADSAETLLCAYLVAILFLAGPSSTPLSAGGWPTLLSTVGA